MSTTTANPDDVSVSVAPTTATATATATAIETEVESYDRSCMRVLGIRICGRNLANAEHCRDVLSMFNQTADYRTLRAFTHESGRDRKGFKTFVFKVCDEMGKHVRSMRCYRDFDAKAAQTDAEAIQKRTFPHAKRYFAHPGNAGKKFLSVDICSANFTALKALSRGTAEEIDMRTMWPAYFRSVVPEDRRSAKPHQGIEAQSFPIPPVVYGLKQMRILCLSKLDKLAAVWCGLNLQNLQAFHKVDAEHGWGFANADANADADADADAASTDAASTNTNTNRVYVNGDEFAVELDSWEQGDAILEQLAASLDPAVSRTSMFSLTRVADVDSNANVMLKKTREGTKSIMNAKDDVWNELWKKHVME
jgi:hypothetical protein